MQREEAHSQSARDLNAGPSCSHWAILDQVLDYPKPWFLHLLHLSESCAWRSKGPGGVCYLGTTLPACSFLLKTKQPKLQNLYSVELEVQLMVGALIPPDRNSWVLTGYGCSRFPPPFLSRNTVLRPGSETDVGLTCTPPLQGLPRCMLAHPAPTGCLLYFYRMGQMAESAGGCYVVQAPRDDWESL